MRYTVASLDVLGNQSQGWEINDQHALGTLDISAEVFEDDQLLLSALTAGGYIEAGTTIEDIYFMGDDFGYLQVHDDVTDRPVLTLSLEQ